MRILRFFFLLQFYCGSVGFLLLLSTWLLTTFDSLGFSPGRCRPVNGPSSAAVNSRQSHTAAHWLPAPAGGSLHRISPSSSTYILLHISLFRRQLHQRCHYKWQLLISYAPLAASGAPPPDRPAHLARLKPRGRLMQGGCSRRVAQTDTA